MSLTISSIFEALKLVYLIEPHYYINWSLLKRLLLSNLEPIQKEKGPMGSARAKQIEIYCIKLFYQFISSCMTKNHFIIFVFMHSILIQNLNNNDLDKFDSIFKMLSISLAQDVHLTDTNVFKKPSNLSLLTWSNLNKLEHFNPVVFKNLTKSLSLNNLKWNEYFNMNINDISEKDIDLINTCPLDQDLTIVEKLVLWISCKPEYFFDIISKFNIYHLGGLIPKRNDLNLNKAYELSSGSVPILISTPKGMK